MWKIQINLTGPNPQLEPVFNPLKMIHFDPQSIWPNNPDWPDPISNPPTPPILPWLPARIKQKKKKCTTWKAKLGCSIYTQKKKRHNKIVKADETVNALTCKSEVRSKIQNTEPLKSHRWVVHWVELYAIPLCQPIIWFPFPPTTTTAILNHSLFHHNLHSILISKSNPYFLYSTFEIHLHLNSKTFISSSTPICLKYLTTCPSQQKRQQEKRKKKANYPLITIRGKFITVACTWIYFLVKTKTKDKNKNKKNREFSLGIWGWGI